ncbi:MAG TPA: hypothetical protein PLD53_04315, partial [Candidatus Propionivibrio aalborgensis]|nr:hypothetical protein [Candidatus Propionivibrio aalborgensis]
KVLPAGNKAWRNTSIKARPISSIVLSRASTVVNLLGEGDLTLAGKCRRHGQVPLEFRIPNSSIVMPEVTLCNLHKCWPQAGIEACIPLYSACESASIRGQARTQLRRLLPRLAYNSSNCHPTNGISCLQGLFVVIRRFTCDGKALFAGTRYENDICPTFSF